MITSNYVRPMSIVEIYRSALDLYRNNFFKLGLINLIQVIGIGLFAIAQGGAVTTNNLGAQCLFLIAEYTLLFILNLVSAAAFVATSNAVLGRPVSFSGAYSRVLSTQLFGKLAVVTILASVIFIIGLILLVIPGLVFYLWFAFVPLVVTLEKKGGRAALGRSRELVRGNFWRVFWGYFVFCLVPYAVVVNLISGSVASSLGLTILDGMSYMLVVTVINSLFIFVLAPLINLVFTLFYYDLRARNESFNEELLAQEMGYKPVGEMVTV